MSEWLVSNGREWWSVGSECLVVVNGDVAKLFAIIIIIAISFFTRSTLVKSCPNTVASKILSLLLLRLASSSILRRWQSNSQQKPLPSPSLDATRALSHSSVFSEGQRSGEALNTSAWARVPWEVGVAVLRSTRGRAAETLRRGNEEEEKEGSPFLSRGGI
jgi:hypothetical protein